MRITFFKTGRPKQFNYIPRYYDEQKEEAAERKRRIELELGIADSAGGFQSSLRRGVMSRKLTQRRKANHSTTLRLLIIIAILGCIAWYFIGGDFTFNFLPK